METREQIDETRDADFRRVDGAAYDVAVIGAGVSGARIFHQLCSKGYRVLLLDRCDFASGTSQASGMMIWGGLLYLKDLDFSTVRKLCRARDEWIEQAPEKVSVAGLSYLQGRKETRSRCFVRAGLLLYWLMGSWKRMFPKDSPAEGLLDFLKHGRFRGSFSFEEAVLKHSDCRFALEWILPFSRGECAALNHCGMDEASFDNRAARWNFALRDRLFGYGARVSARFVVNAAGVWTDEVNVLLGVESPYRHELSKGVYVSVARPESLTEIVVFDTGREGDTFTVSPWGPVALCGPTETRVTCLRQGFRPETEDVRQLLKVARENLDGRFDAGDVVSLRCGVRPLAVKRGFSKIVHPLELSRKHLIHHHRHRKVVAVYGGKLTSCGLMAGEVERRIAPFLRGMGPVTAATQRAPELEKFPSLSDPVSAAEWCRDHEQCLTLEDYLRRRTNIAQWVPRGGLGRNSENTEAIRRIARVFNKNERSAEAAMSDYQESIRKHHDGVLAAV